MEDAVYDVATAAYDQLLTARSLMNQIPGEAFPALLSAVSCDCGINDCHLTPYLFLLRFRTWDIWKIWKRSILMCLMLNYKRKTGNYLWSCINATKLKQFKHRIERICKYYIKIQLKIEERIQRLVNDLRLLCDSWIEEAQKLLSVDDWSSHTVSFLMNDGLLLIFVTLGAAE